MRTLTVMFRGKEMLVVVDRYDVDYEVNALECEWHFDGVSPDVHELLNVTDVEEQAIIDAICNTHEDLE